MQILILGGSGRTGKLVIDEALRRNHSVAALVRNESSLKPRGNLTVVKGTPLKQEDIEAAFEATPSPPDAVIVTLNAARASDSPFAKPITPPRFLADSNENAVAVMRKYGVRRIVTMSAFGVADSSKEMAWLMRHIIRKTNMSYQFEDHDLVDKEMKTSGTDYTLVRPVVLSEGEDLPVKDFGDSGKGVGMMSKITRKSVASYLVKAAETNELRGRTPVIANV
ncbi:NAD(P)-binding protein [Rhizodiscina lignyota]|uniref:NAD(P)-binding protein n=1 Tax=Rhizodiscina lignyota TaxID=1504668 RepID=A0A9P4IJ29_9PEZI|nr:NAD(P)-binding protein [Rhizodiscina lignyota]